MELPHNNCPTVATVGQFLVRCSSISKRLVLKLFLFLLGPLISALSLAADTQFANFSDARASAQKLPRLNSLLVSYQDRILVEDYFGGTDPKRPANMKSASKSVISALIGIAIEEGFITSVNVPIAQYFPEYISQTLNSDKQGITIEDLLTMESGLATTSNRNYGKWVLSENWVEFAINQPLIAEPGEQMIYSTGSSHLLSAILTKATGMDSKQFAQQYLTSKLGYSMSYWPQDPQGIYFGGNDMEMTPRQMLSFGKLYLNGGLHEGEQVVPAYWVSQSHTAHADSPRGQGRQYGYGWWLRDLAGLQVPVAWGYGGQLIFVIEELDLVVVATSNSVPGPDRRGHLKALYDLVEFQIIQPALEGLGRFD
jgi:CubicO group peptidase (beta-lactamase class C family)